MISGHGNLDTAVAAVREGAIDFIEKPFEAERLIYLVDRATETERLRRENEVLRHQVGQEDQLHGSSVAINTVRATLKRVAPTGSRVLISGPPGVGKEIAARMIHQWSPRARAPFIVLSAAMMSPERVEEELFGSEADGVMRPGLLEHAHGGTLFLDEIADMPLTTQAKILRVLTDQSYHRVGGQRAVKVDVRVLSATSRNLQDEINAGRFREDLFYRLNVVPVKLPPLRERREDIPELVSHFLARIATGRRMPAPRISEEAMAALQAHDWPGNIRQLRNIIERTLILAPGDRAQCIEVDLLPPEIVDNQNVMGGTSTSMAIMGSPLREARESFEREYLRIQIRRFSGNISRTASFIGMERSALHRKLKALGIGEKREGEE
jgi:two-component system nitrogen regulation response regulator NtrX